MSRITERSEYRFDPTACDALARVGKPPREEFVDNSSPPTIEPREIDRSNYASAEDLERFRGAIFTPRRLITDKQIRRLRWQVRARENNLQRAKQEGGV